MDASQLDRELELLILKHNLCCSLKIYLSQNIPRPVLNMFYSILKLLQIKYPEEFDFIERGIRCNINQTQPPYDAMTIISPHIHTCNNKWLLKELLSAVSLH